jgi:phosphopantetheinyl transferase
MLAAPGSAGAGLDLERLVPRPDWFASAALSEPERNLLGQACDDQADEWLLRLWCAREAAGKALGTGLGGGEGAPRATALDRGSGAVQVECEGAAVVCWTSREQDVVMASALHPHAGQGGETNGRAR